MKKIITQNKEEMKMSRVYNFSAGPAVLPEEVLQEAAAEMMDYKGSGMSVMEMSHRSKWFDDIIKEAEADLRGIKNDYRKRGIVIFAAAIGDDKENIRRIYQDGFLDITKLEDLPKNMTQLVKQYLK